MDWQSVLKYNPNHDPKDGRFTFAGHGGAALDSPFERAFRRVSEAELRQAVDRYESEQDLRGLVADKYQGKSAYAIVKALQEAHPHLTFRNMEWMHPFALREVATQIDRMANSHPDAFAALDTIGMQETADSVFAATGNHAGAWAAMEHGHMRFNPRYFDMGSNLITDGRHRDDLLTTPVTRAGSLLMELREAEEAGYHPLGNDTVGSIFVHEFGHHVQAFEQGELDYLGKRTKRNGKLLTQRLRQEVDSETAISTYAAVNDREWFAEAFAATYSHDKPKEIRESGRTSIKSIKGIFDHYFNEYDTFARGQPRTKKEDLAQADLDRGGRLPAAQGPKRKRRHGFKRMFQYGEGLVTAITKMNPNHDPKTGRFTEKATAFMQEWIEGSQAHPFDDRQRLRRNVGIDMSPWQGMDQVHLSSIISYGSKGKGEASELMREITQMADEHGVAIDLNAKPIPDAGAKGKGLTKAQLVAWYKRHGFKQSPGYGDPSYLTRFPTAKKYDEMQPRDEWGRWTTNAANPWSHPTRHDLMYMKGSSPKYAEFQGPPKEGDRNRNPQWEKVPRWYLPKDHPAYSDAFPPPAPIVDKAGIGPGFKEERQNADGSWNVPQPGESFLVYRIDSGKHNSLQGVNAGNADGVVGFYDDMNDFEQPERGYTLGSHVSLYKVTLGKHFGEYETIRDRSTYGSPVVGRSAGDEKDFPSVWYSFPARDDSHTSERVASVPMTTFPRHGFSPEAIRRAFKEHLDRIRLQTSATTSDQARTQKHQFSTILKFNPFHDARGRFTTAQNAKQQEGHDELPTVEAMNRAMQLVGMEQFERAVFDHLESLGRRAEGTDQAYEIERVARRIIAENRGKVTKCDFTMPLQYFIEIGDAYRAFKFDESKHPREPAGTPKGGQFAQWRQGTGMYFDDKVWRYGGDHSEVPEPVAARLKGMAIPPASINVHLNPDPTEPLQATWTARNGKLQYRYSAEAMGSNAAEKFSRLKDFNGAMPLLRRRSHDDMLSGKTQAERDTAAVVRLMSKTGFRVGGENEFETKKGKAYGASTLLDRHVVVSGTKLTFNFPGKHAVMQSHELNDMLLAQYIRNRKRHTTKDERLFATNEGRVNKYLKDVTGQPFSAKDFRTWHGTYTALKVLKEIGEPATEAEYRKARVHVGDVVSKHLGNTRMVALGSYIDPTVWGRWAGKEKTKRKKHDD